MPDDVEMITDEFIDDVTDDEPEVDDTDLFADDTNESEDDTVEDPDEAKEEDEEEKKASETAHPFDRPSLAQIKAAYPDIFQKFPQLKDMYFREKEYTELFSTVGEAKEAAENNSAFAAIQSDIMTGTGEQFFSAVKEADPKALDRFAGNLMHTLSRVDRGAFFKAANPLVQDVALRMYEKGVKEGDANLQNSAKFLAEFFFGHEDFATGAKSSVTAEVPKDNSVENERQQFQQERYSAALDNVQTSAKGKLIALIDNDKFDPHGALTPFVKKTIIDSIVRDIGQQLTADKQHVGYMDRLWAEAKRGNYKDLSRIESAFLARAKNLVTTLRSKYVSEATGKRIAIAKDAKQKIQSIQSRKSGGGGSAPSGNSGSGKIDYRKTSNMDILNDTVTYKGK